MSMKIHFRPLTLCLLTPLTIVAIGCEEAKTESEMEELLDQSEALKTVLRYDAAENMHLFVSDDAPVFEEDGFPAYGNPFLTQGYIYPHGHLDASDGTNADGSPTDPDEVLGIWTCRGYMVGDGAHTQEGPMVLTTQQWNFYETPGYDPDEFHFASSIVNEGYESAEVGVKWQRPITGGAGEHIGASGQSIQEFRGINPSEGFNFRVKFELED